MIGLVGLQNCECENTFTLSHLIGNQYKIRLIWFFTFGFVSPVQKLIDLGIVVIIMSGNGKDLKNLHEE